MQTRAVPFQVRISWLDTLPIIEVKLDAATAKRKVSGWASGHVATSCGGGTPELVLERERVFWRVPVVFTHRLVGHVGEIGKVNVDAQTGEMAVSDQLAEAMLKNAVALADTLPKQTEPA